MAGELILQNKIRKKLEFDGWWTFKMPPIVTGFPDLMALRGGKVIFIEVKNGVRGKLGLQQAKIIHRLRALGFAAVVIKDMDEWSEFYGGL